MITQDQLSMVAIPSMNDTHLEDMLLLNKLSIAVQNKDIVLKSTTLAEFIQHTLSHFSTEEEMMQEKEFLLVSAYIDGSLAPWMLHHVQTLDTQMALFLKNTL